ncbi:MAG TPA: 5-(carboxyamino)imidazole ribonucleotide synthase [Galbitalea sp.]|jgi:5-(carboxyamino)imidazole ribonucleotide synthase|nr:5-(carboxyamino)imidazole ribonucleotide synthase [Galbitalea sp.]
MSPIVGVIGGGQLARMMIPPAVELGVGIRVFAETRGESADLAVTATGDFRNSDEVLAFARTVDVVTFDHEQVPQSVLADLLAAGVVVRPVPSALLYAQDKLAMREKLGGLGLPMPEWARVTGIAELAEFLAAHGGRAVLKAPRGGYDGRGVRVVHSAEDAADWFGDGDALLVEEHVEFRRELAQLVARRPSGELTLWPVVESVQRNEVCAEVIAPAPLSTGRITHVAAEIGTAVANALDVTGVFTVELFETTDDRLIINELAMRPHNTGHWTIEGSITSQFEQHLRAVLDLPLGSTDARAPWSVMVNVLGGPSSGSLADEYPRALADQPTVKFHNYGKQSRPGRKVGHVTATGSDLDDTVFRARAASEFFAGAPLA